MKVFLLLVLALLTTSAWATSPVCLDSTFPKRVEGVARVETDAGSNETHYTIVLPERYKGETLNFAWLKVFNSSGGFVRVPLETRHTGVAEWKHSLVGFVHAERDSSPLAVEAEFGFPCRWILTVSAGSP